MPSTVVADVGGTTSRWGVLTEDRSQLVVDGLPGFNPAVGEPDVFASAVRARFQGLGIDVADLFVYGAGCGSPDRCSRMGITVVEVVVAMQAVAALAGTNWNHAAAPRSTTGAVEAGH